METNGIIHAGVSILIKSTIPRNLIQLIASLQAVAVHDTLHKTISVCSICLPSSQKYNSSDLEDLILQLPPPVLLLGNLNTHSSLWGCSKTCIRGKLVENLILEPNLSLLNDGSYTYSLLAHALQLISVSLTHPSTWILHGRFTATSMEVITSPL